MSLGLKALLNLALDNTAESSGINAELMLGSLSKMVNTLKLTTKVGLPNCIPSSIMLF